MFLRLPSLVLNLDHLHSVTLDPADPARVAIVIDHAAAKPPRPGGKGKGPAAPAPGGFEDQPREVLVLSGADAAAVLGFFTGGPGGGAPEGLVVDRSATTTANEVTTPPTPLTMTNPSP